MNRVQIRNVETSFENPNDPEQAESAKTDAAPQTSKSTTDAMEVDGAGGRKKIERMSNLSELMQDIFKYTYKDLTDVDIYDPSQNMVDLASAVVVAAGGSSSSSSSSASITN